MLGVIVNNVTDIRKDQVTENPVFQVSGEPLEPDKDFFINTRTHMLLTQKEEI